MAGTVRWKEPAAFKRALARRSGARVSPWPQALFALGVGAAGLAACVTHDNPVNGSWPLTVAATAGVGVLIAFGLPLLASLDPNLVAVTGRGVGWRVHKGGAVSVECWAWDGIARCELADVELEGRAWRVFVIRSPDGAEAYFALGPRVSEAALAEAVRANGRELSGAAADTSEE